MYRGGRGGANTGGRMRGQQLPFEVADLEVEIHAYGDDRKQADNPHTALYPPYPGGVPRAPPPNDEERYCVKLYREMQAKTRSSIFYMGPLKDSRKRSAADFNPFEDQETYGKRLEKDKDFRMPNLKKHKFLRDFQPKELWEVIGVTVDGGDDASLPKKKLALASRKNIDKLAKFDEDAAERAPADDVKDDENEEAADDDGEEGAEVPVDDTFEEDEEDAGDDYNAEQYFDGGEDEFHDGGQDEYGDE